MFLIFNIRTFRDFPVEWEQAKRAYEFKFFEKKIFVNSIKFFNLCTYQGEQQIMEAIKFSKQKSVNFEKRQILRSSLPWNRESSKTSTQIIKIRAIESFKSSSPQF